LAYALGKDMRRSSIATSAMLHAAALILVTISFPWWRHKYDEAPQPMSVEMVTVADMAQTTKVAPQIKKEQVKPAEPEKKVEPKKPPPAPTNKAEEPKQAIEKPVEKTEEVKEEKPVFDENAIPKKQPKKVDKKPDNKKAEPKKQDFTALLKNLTDAKTQPAPPMPPQPATKVANAADGQPLPLGERMTRLESDALRQQLAGCWNLPAGAKDAETTTVDIYMVINQDRTLQSAQIVDQSRYNSDSFYAAMADSALRAVRNPNCSPFDLPPDKYDAWKTMTVTFDPSQMF
jgi:outer membrane biosynthesis protein TonB